MGALEGGIQLVGDRLFLREFVSDDCSAVQSYAGDAEVTRFTDWGPNSLEETRSFLAATAAQSGMPDRREFDLAVVDVAARYRRSVKFGEPVVVHAGIATITRTLIEIAYLVTVGDDVVLTGVTTHACVNPEGRPMRVPEWLLDLGEGATALRA